MSGLTHNISFQEHIYYLERQGCFQFEGHPNGTHTSQEGATSVVFWMTAGFYRFPLQLK